LALLDELSRLLLELKPRQFAAVPTSLFGQDRTMRVRDAHGRLPTVAVKVSLVGVASAMTRSRNSGLMDSRFARA